MGKVYLANKEDLKRVDNYMGSLMEDRGLASITVNNHGTNSVVFDGRSKSIENAVKMIERDLGIRLTPTECVYFPNLCSYHDNLEELSPDSLAVLSALNQQNTLTKYCTTSECVKCPQYAEKWQKNISTL